MSNKNKHFMSSVPACNNCKSLKSFYQKNGNVDAKKIEIKKTKNREIYFAPVGNHYNFGFYNKNHTPKIVIMGMTTSPTARDKFYESVKNNINEDMKLEEAVKKACMENTFNSEKPGLLNTLSKIFNLSGIWKLFGIKNDYNLSTVFNHYKNPKYKEITENIYFTQFIPCCSCYTMKDRKAPKKTEIDKTHLECIEFQKQLFNTFNKDVDLLISFGEVDTFPEFGNLKDKCKKHFAISHPAGASLGWNEIKYFHLNEKQFNKKLKDSIPQTSNNKGYITGIKNCYNQVQSIKNLVSSWESKKK